MSEVALALLSQRGQFGRGHRGREGRIEQQRVEVMDAGQVRMARLPPERDALEGGGGAHRHAAIDLGRRRQL